MKKLLGTIVLGLLSMSVLPDQTGNCTAGEQYCEENSLTTTNSTTTANTNTNTNNHIHFASIKPNLYYQNLDRHQQNRKANRSHPLSRLQ